MTILGLFNFGALFMRVVAHLSEELLQCNNISACGRANLPFPARLKPQKWLYLANTFLAPCSRGVAALVLVLDDKIQMTLLILGRGALSHCEHSNALWLCSHILTSTFNFKGREKLGSAKDYRQPKGQGRGCEWGKWCCLALNWYIQNCPLTKKGKSFAACLRLPRAGT